MRSIMLNKNYTSTFHFAYACNMENMWELRTEMAMTWNDAIKQIYVLRLIEKHSLI